MVPIHGCWMFCARNSPEFHKNKQIVNVFKWNWCPLSQKNKVTKAVWSPAVLNCSAPHTARASAVPGDARGGLGRQTAEKKCCEKGGVRRAFRSSCRKVKQCLEGREWQQGCLEHSSQEAGLDGYDPIPSHPVCCPGPWAIWEERQSPAVFWAAD